MDRTGDAARRAKLDHRDGDQANAPSKELEPGLTQAEAASSELLAAATSDLQRSKNLKFEI